MTYWTWRRWAALLVHIILAIGLLAWSISSSLHFWQWAFKDEVYAWGAVAFLDGLALLGFVLYIARVQSPLVYARHMLPVVSAGPLVFDMHSQFQHLQDAWLVWPFTLGVTTLLVGLAYAVWSTIEELFVSPVEAARDYASAQMQALHIRSAQMQVMQQEVQGFVQTHQPLLQPPRVEVHARPADAPQVVHVPTTRFGDAPDVVHQMQAVEHHAPAVVHGDAFQVDPGAFPASFTHNATHYRCPRCGSVNETPPGKVSSKLRGASGQWGCPACKEAALP